MPLTQLVWILAQIWKREAVSLGCLLFVKMAPPHPLYIEHITIDEKYPS